TVLHLLEALQVLQMKVGSGPTEARRLSFRALDVEQIGHVYETLLDHTARRAQEPLLRLVHGKDLEPVVALADLEREYSRGESVLLGYLVEKTGRTESALRRALVREQDFTETQRLHAACDNDERLVERVRPFAGLLECDPTGYPLVIGEGSFYVG